jgi:LuxR family maltose regulon positive regulatory protein
LAEPEGYMRIFVREGEALADLLPNIESEYGQRILAAFAKKQAHSPSGQDQASVQERGELVDPLSERELEVLHLIAEGLKNQAIADKLFISLHTVKIHARRIYAKLGVSRRTQAVAKAKEIHIL